MNSRFFYDIPYSFFQKKGLFRLLRSPDLLTFKLRILASKVQNLSATPFFKIGISRAELKVTEPNLRFPAVFCEHFRFSATICDSLRFPAPSKFGKIEWGVFGRGVFK